MGYQIDTETAGKLACHLLGEKNENVTVRPVSTGKFSSTFFVNIPNETSEYVIRISPPDDLLLLFYEKRMMRQEPEIHQLISQKTTIPIPDILAYDFSRKLIDRDFLIMNRMPGTPLSQMQHRLSRQQLMRVFREWGALVAQLHTITREKYGYLGAHHPMHPCTRWDDAFGVMWQKMLDDCVNCGIYTAAIQERALALWKRYRSAFVPDCPATLCHMDLWVENVLVDTSGRVSCLFDFDRACYGDAENDLAVAEYCGITNDAFWEGYGSFPVRNREWAIRRWFYLLYEHQKYIVIRVSARKNDIPGAKKYAAECWLSIQNFWQTGVPEF